MRQILVRLGYTVDTCQDPAAALARFKEHPETYDLVMSDMTMPGMTGADLAGAVLAVRADMPIILCTGYSEQMDAQKAADLGIRGFLMKPVGLADLARTVRQVLDEDKTKRQAPGTSLNASLSSNDR